MAAPAGRAFEPAAVVAGQRTERGHLLVFGNEFYPIRIELIGAVGAVLTR